MDDLRNGRFRSFAAGQWPFSQCTYVGESRPNPDRFVISRMDSCLFIASKHVVQVALPWSLV